MGFLKYTKDLIKKSYAEFNKLKLNEYLEFSTDYSETGLEPIGTTYWDGADKTLTTVLPNGVKLQHGHELYKLCVNKTGSLIPNGSVVFVSDAQGQRPVISLADADNYSNSLKTIGVTTQDIDDNAEGKVTTFGEVRDLDTSGFNDGDCLYVSTTAGELTNVTPTFGKARIAVGMVMNTHPTQGKILVCIKPHWYLFGDVDNGNYSGFESDGTLKFVGNGTVWKDENAGGVSLTKANSNQPDLITINGTNILTYAFDGVNSLEELHWNVEIQHDYKEGTDLWPHMHFYPTTTGAGNVKFFLEYYIKESGNTPVQGTTSFVLAAGGVAWEELRINFDDVIDGTNLSIADQAHFRVYRDPNDVEDTYGDDVAIATLGYHYEIDTVGSRGIVTK